MIRFERAPGELRCSPDGPFGTSKLFVLRRLTGDAAKHRFPLVGTHFDEEVVTMLNYLGECQIESDAGTGSRAE